MADGTIRQQTVVSYCGWVSHEHIVVNVFGGGGGYQITKGLSSDRAGTAHGHRVAYGSVFPSCFRVADDIHDLA